MAPERSTAGGKWLAAAIVLAVFEGAVRKWMFPNSSPAVQAVPYFSKDIAIVIAVLVSVERRRKGLVLSKIRYVLLWSTFLIVLGSLLVLDDLAPVGAVVSFRDLVLLWWAAWLIGPALRPADVRLICLTIGICAAVNAVLGSIQFFLPATNILNQMPTSKDRAVEAVGRVRASGTFAFITGMSSLCIFACWAAAVTVWRQPLSFLGYSYAFVGLTCSFEAMNRSGVMFGLALIFLTVAFHPRGRWYGSLGVAVIAVVFILMGGSSSQESDANDPGISNAILVRHKRSDTVEERLTWMLLDPFYAMAEFPVGTGLGRGQTGQRAVDETLPFTYETEPARIVYEIGMLGLAGALVARIGILLALWNAWPKVLSEARQSWEGAIFPSLALFPFLIYHNTCFDHVMATFTMIIMAIAIASVSFPTEE